VTRRLRPIASVVVAASLAAAAGCGKKAPPLAPLVIRPAAPEDVQVVRVADTVHIRFTVPDKNGDGKSPARLSRVDVIGLTGEAQDPDGKSLTAAALLREASLVGSVEIEPPPPPAPREAKTSAPADPAAPAPPPPPAPPDDPRPAQGEVVTITERVTPAVLTKYVPTGKKKLKPVVRVPRPWDDFPLPLVTEVVEPLGRMYVVVGRDAKGRPGALSARVSVPLDETPPAPEVPTLRHTETAIVVEWVVPPGARRPVFEPVPVPVVPPAPAEPVTQPQGPVVPDPGAVASPAVPAAASVPPAPADAVPAVVPAPVETLAVMPRTLVKGPTPHTFNLYLTTTAPAAGLGAAAPATTPVSPAPRVDGIPLVPLNPAPLSVLTFEDPAMAFGVERCYVLRMVEARPNGRVEGPSSPEVCITPVDTFPPQAPRSLAAVGSEGAVNLIWEPNTERDLGGYIVLRGLAGGGALTALTPTPIKETTYRDAQVTRGQRYVYAIVAVDTVTPQNVSVESNRVEETAR
jgi:hypothetical protein